MPFVRLATQDDFDGGARRRALGVAGIPPERWLAGRRRCRPVRGTAEPPMPARPRRAKVSVPRLFVDLAQTAILHAIPSASALLYSAAAPAVARSRG